MTNIKGIYLIERITNNDNEEEPRYYIGQATDIFDRWKQHCNSREQYIDKCINKHKYISFSFRILEEVRSKSEREIRERFWIDSYVKKYSEKEMYNHETGGTIGKSKINIERSNQEKLSKEIKADIIQLFEIELGRSIYAISEKYNRHWRDVCDIRKPILKKNGLKWQQGHIVDKDGNEPKNWNGGRITQTQLDYFLVHQNEEDDDIANGCNLSISDLKIFRDEYEKNNKQYVTADSI